MGEKETSLEVKAVFNSFFFSTHFLFLSTAYLRSSHTSLLSDLVLTSSSAARAFISLSFFLQNYIQEPVSPVHSPELDFHIKTSACFQFHPFSKIPKIVYKGWKYLFFRKLQITCLKKKVNSKNFGSYESSSPSDDKIEESLDMWGCTNNVLAPIY